MSRDRRLRLRLILTAAFVLSPLATAPTAFASCAAPPPLEILIESSDVVIVGTVTALANDDRWAQVSVEQIWRGGPQPSVVEVRGGPEPGTFSSVDRTFVTGRYLFTLGFDGTHLTDNICSGTIAYTDDMVGLRPAGWTAPGATPAPESGGVDQSGLSGVLLPALAVALLALLVIGGSWLISRRAG